MADTERVCSKCKDLKPIDEFGNKTIGKDGKKSICTQCELQYRKERRLKGNPPKAEKRGKARKNLAVAKQGDGWWPDFLEKLSEHGMITRASEQANIGQAEVYKVKKENDEFRALFDEARAIGLGRCVDEAIRRGCHGFEEVIYKNGEIVGTKRRYSDKLLEFIIRGNFSQYKNVGTNNVNVSNKMSISEAITSFEEDE